MSAVPENPDSASSPGKPLSRGFRLYLLLVLPLAILEGALAGGLQGGFNGALNGSLFGALLGPTFAWWAWSTRQDPRAFWNRVLLSIAIEAAGGFAIGLASRFLAFLPIWPFAVLGAFGATVVITYLHLAAREFRRVTRGAIIGAILLGIVGPILGAILAVEIVRQGEPVIGAIVVLFFSCMLWINGAVAGGFVGPAIRLAIRICRCALIRVRCRWRRRRDEGGAPDADSLDLADVDLVFAAGHDQVELARMLLQALAEGAQVVLLQPTRAVCRRWQVCRGLEEELVPIRLTGAELARQLFSLGELAPASRDEWRGPLSLRVAGDTLRVLASLRLEGRRSGMLLRFPAESPPPGVARRLLRDYREMLGDPWKEEVTPIVVRSGQAGAPRQPEHEPGEARHGGVQPESGRPVLLRLVYSWRSQGKWHYRQTRSPLAREPVAFDGDVIGIGDKFGRFSFSVQTTVGSHLLELDPNRRLPWVGRNYLVHIAEPGAYELRFRWDQFWASFRKHVEVRPLDAEAAAAGNQAS